MEGIKNDLGKNRLDLIPPEAIEVIGRAFTHGAIKYGAHNYRKGVDYSRLYSAALRHLNAFWGGEDIDADSGLPHLALAGSEICMLIAMGAECDDRYKCRRSLGRCGKFELRSRCGYNKQTQPLKTRALSAFTAIHLVLRLEAMRSVPLDPK